MANKTTVKIENLRGNLRLRWSYQGKRYCLSLGLYDSPLARTVAQGKANIIEADLITGNFDVTLNKYRGEVADASKKSTLTVVELFNRFTQHREQGITKRTAEKYAAVATKVAEYFQERTASIDLDTAVAFRSWLSGTLAPVSQKEYLNLLCSCWAWGIQQEWLTVNPWQEVKRIKVPPKQRPRPFTTDEMQAILDGFKHSRYYKHYSNFVTFLFCTGCRTGEAIGLRWGHLSEDCGKVWIGESVSRGVRKATKTNQAREFRLSPKMQAILLNCRPEDWKQDDLVFPAVYGGTIDDHGFRNRAWVTVLKQAGVAYRKPYNTRHTFISHALAKGCHPMTIAQMTGHDPEILFKHYAADIQGGLQLPDII